MFTTLGLLFACNADLPPELSVDVAAPTEVLAGGPIALALTVVDEAPAAASVVVSGDAPVQATGPSSAGEVVLTVSPPAPGPYTVEAVVTDRGGQTGQFSWAFTAVSGDQDGDGSIDVVWGGTDCDDGDEAVNTAAPELCNGVDDDCDEAVDEDPDDGVLVWPDADRDGYGDEAAAPIRKCGTTPAWVDNAEDCADDHALVFPLHVQVGEVGCEGFGAAFTWLGEVAGDAAGDRVQSAGDLDGDGALEVGISAPLGAGGAGAVYIVDASGPGEASLASARAILRGGQRGDTLGFELAAIGDWDGDGVADLVVGAPGVADFDEGAVYIVRGPLVGEHAIDDVAEHRVFGMAPGDGLGAVASAGDTDGDGRSEVIVGASAGSLGAGYVALLDELPAGDSDLAEVAKVILVGEPGVAAGDPGPGADLDGDGLMDLLIGAQEDGTNGPESGAVYVVPGPAGSGVWSLEAAAAKLLGPVGSIAGHALDVVGDIDGDGLQDFVIGAPYADERSGIVYLVRGGSVSGVASLTTAARALIGGETLGDRAGFSVAGPGDVDGDGRIDLAIGAKFEDSPGIDGGSVYLTDADLEGVVILGDVEMKLIGEGPGDLFGDVAAVGDLDGDGFDDLVVGAREHFEGKVQIGAAYVVFGAAF